MYVCMYVCVHIHIYMYTCEHICVNHSCVYIYMCIHIHVYVCIYIYMSLSLSLSLCFHPEPELLPARHSMEWKPHRTALSLLPWRKARSGNYQEAWQPWERKKRLTANFAWDNKEGLSRYPMDGLIQQELLPYRLNLTHPSEPKHQI